MKSLILTVQKLHGNVFATVEKLTHDWFLGLAARFVFASVLFFYYINSAQTKVGDGILGFFSVQSGAYYQIALPAVEAAGFDPSAVAFFPWGLIVYAGTYAEFILPVLIVIGLFSRLSALGMIGFVVVQSLTDVAVHQLDEKSVGAMFDRFSDALIYDQRLLWVFMLLVIVIKGGGKISADYLLSRTVK